MFRLFLFLRSRVWGVVGFRGLGMFRDQGFRV